MLKLISKIKWDKRGPLKSTSFVSYLYLLFTIDGNSNSPTKLYGKRDAFTFHIVAFPIMLSNTPSAPVYYYVYAS